eukprot:5839338-Prymnesium_polylepis.1
MHSVPVAMRSLNGATATGASPGPEEQGWPGPNQPPATPNAAFADRRRRILLGGTKGGSLAVAGVSEGSGPIMYRPSPPHASWGCAVQRAATRCMAPPACWSGARPERCCSEGVEGAGLLFAPQKSW